MEAVEKGMNGPQGRMLGRTCQSQRSWLQYSPKDCNYLGEGEE